jgi:hypothetical protein
MARTIHGILTLWAGVLAGTNAFAQGGGDRRPVFEVVVDNRASAGAAETGTARLRADYIFGEAGIRIAWLPKGEEHGTSAGVADRIHLVLIDESSTRLIPKHPTRLGFAIPAAGRVYVHYDRVHELARLHGVQPGWFLGVVIAHELVHVLLPLAPHTGDGVMKRTLSPDPKVPAAFSRTEAQSLRDRLRGETTLAQR